jgi:hypothetical protein
MIFDLVIDLVSVSLLIPVLINLSTSEVCVSETLAAFPYSQRIANESGHITSIAFPTVFIL